MTNALAVYDEMDLPTIAEAMFKSGLFSDTKSMAQAIVKVIAGRELGIGPVAAMRGIDIIQGKVALSASLTAALVKQTGRYTYYVVAHDAKVCSIEFHERDTTTGGWSPIGTSTFTMEMANRAGLVSKGVWTQYPEAMLWARAMTQGAGWFCPDATEGRFYTAEELGADEAPQGSESEENTPGMGSGSGKPISGSREAESSSVGAEMRIDAKTPTDSEHTVGVPLSSDEAEEAAIDEPVPPASAPPIFGRRDARASTSDSLTFTPFDTITPNDENPLGPNAEKLARAGEQHQRVVTLYGGQKKSLEAAWKMYGISAKDLPVISMLSTEQAEQMIKAKGGL